jgi:3-oxoadipate enol-lactonase
MKKMKVGHNELAYLEIGEGQPLVFLHGFCGSMEYWDRVANILKKDYRVILIDLRGHGKSSSNVYPFTIDDLAKDIKEVIESLHLGQVYLFGHSLGGYISLSLLEHFPEKIKGYGLIHSTALPDTEDGKHGRYLSVEHIEKNGIQSFIDGFVPRIFADESTEALQNEVQLVKQIGYSTDSKAAQQMLLAMRVRPDRRNILEKPIPVLLIAGESDKVIPVEKTIIVEGPHIVSKVIRGAGHMSMYENTEDLTKAIRDFLENENLLF